MTPLQINQDLSPFEAAVLQSLTRLETKMDNLTGSTDEPGRIPTLETKVFRLTLALIATAVLGIAGASPHAITIFSWLIK